MARSKLDARGWPSDTPFSSHITGPKNTMAIDFIFQQIVAKWMPDFTFCRQDCRVAILAATFC
jgi:hypothetical protein